MQCTLGYSFRVFDSGSGLELALTSTNIPQGCTCYGIGGGLPVGQSHISVGRLPQGSYFNLTNTGDRLAFSTMLPGMSQPCSGYYTVTDGTFLGLNSADSIQLPSDSSGGVQVGVIIGVICGGAVLIIIVAALSWYCFCKASPTKLDENSGAVTASV